MIIRAPTGSKLLNLKNGQNQEVNKNYSYVEDGFNNVGEKNMKKIDENSS